MAKTLYCCPREKVSGEVKDKEEYKGRREGEEKALGEDSLLEELEKRDDSIVKKLQEGEDSRLKE